jgi:hypothetical protein
MDRSMSHASRQLRRLSHGLRLAVHQRRAVTATLAVTGLGLVSAPLAFGAPLDGAARNPGNNTSTGYQNETQIIGSIAQGKGGVAANTGGYTTRQSNKSDSGGGAIYGCRAEAGTESCVAANNLGNGDAFRFQSTPSANAVGQIRFGLDISKPIDKPPFVTNGTGLVKNLNADQVDGQSASDFVAKGSLLFARVAADGTISANRGVPANGKATVDSSGGNQAFTVPFSGDLSQCVATANPTETSTEADEPLVVATGSDKSTIVVTEQNAATAFGFQLQVTC